MNCIVHLNGWPGSGKRTIGAILAATSGARLLDVHAMLNPAEALFESLFDWISQLRVVCPQGGKRCGLTQRGNDTRTMAGATRAT